MPKPERLRRIERRLAALREAINGGYRRLWNYFFVQRRRMRERVRRAVQPVTTLAIEVLESRDYLTILTFLQNVSTTWNATNVNWQGSGGRTAWVAGDTAEFDSSAGSITVNLAAGLTVQVTGLTFTGGSNSQTTINGGSGSLIANYLGNSIAASIDPGTLAAIAANMSSQASGSDPGGVQVSGGGGVQFAGNVTVSSVSISAGNAEVLAGANVTAATINVTGGAFMIDPTSLTTPQVIATTVNVSSGNFDVEGLVNVATSMMVSGSAVLEGAATGLVTLAAGCPLVYSSSQPCDFTPQIAGTGYLNVDTTTGGSFTLDNPSNNYSGGTQVHAGLLQTGLFGGLPNDFPLALYGTSVFDINGTPCFVLSLYGDPGVVITNSASPASIPPSVVIGVSGSSSSIFSGTTEDGSLGGGVTLNVENTTLTLTRTANISSSGGIILEGAQLIFDETGSAAVTVACSITSDDEDLNPITFDVAADAPTTFTGEIANGGGLTLTKDGPGTLTLTPNAACSYLNMSVVSGTLLYGNANAFSATSNIDVNNSATLDGGGITGLPAFNYMTLNGGTISDGVFTVTDTITVKSGTINADATLTGAALLDKEESTTVTLDGSVSATSAAVNTGTLDVFGALTSSVTVNSAAILKTEAGSTVTGSVDNYSTATSTLAGQVADGGTTGISVFAGTVIVTSPNGPDDGSDLTVGSLAATAFAAPLNPQSMFFQRLTDPGSPDLSTGPVTDNGLNLYQEIHDADLDAFSAVSAIVLPGRSQASLSTSESLEVGDAYLAIVLGAISNNGGTPVGLTTAAIDASIVSWLGTQGLSATPNSDSYTPAYNNPWNYGGLVVPLDLLQFFATHDIS